MIRRYEATRQRDPSFAGGSRQTVQILGISCFYHDSAAALVRDGEIIGAAQEERFTRRKHDPGFPLNAVRYCLESGDIRDADLDLVVFYEKPFIKFERILETYLTFAPRGFPSFLMALMVSGLALSARIL